MPDQRLLRLLARLSADDGQPTGTTRLCVACAAVTEMTGAGIMLIADDRPHGSVCTTDAVSALIEDLQFTLGEGPCVDAHREQRPVVEPDLANPDVRRWASFTPPVLASGVRAVFGFPISVGDVRVGALNLYRDRPGPLTDDQRADAVAIAGIAARAIFEMQADAEPGVLGAALEVGTNFQFVVHQAAGMVSVQLGVGVAEATLRLRALAFSTGRLVADVARDVVARRLRFDPSDGEPVGT
jgi:GAF domain-containing protein